MRYTAPRVPRPPMLTKSEPSGATRIAVGANPFVPVGSRKTSGLTVLVAAPFGNERQVIDLAEGPVAQEHAAAVMGRELRVAITADAGRRPAAHVGKHFDRVRVVIRPGQRAHPTGQPPAVMSAGHHMINPRRRIPRQAVIALGVAVVSNDVAVRREVEVVRIAKAVGDDFRLGVSPVRKSDDPACDRRRYQRAFR